VIGTVLGKVEARKQGGRRWTGERVRRSRWQPAGGIRGLGSPPSISPMRVFYLCVSRSQLLVSFLHLSLFLTSEQQLRCRPPGGARSEQDGGAIDPP
jgi:hypothetical protein